MGTGLSVPLRTRPRAISLDPFLASPAFVMNSGSGGLTGGGPLLIPVAESISVPSNPSAQPS